MPTKRSTATDEFLMFSVKDYENIDLNLIMAILPRRTDDILDTAMLGRMTNNDGWSCVYRKITCLGKTPKEAVLKMLVELGTISP